jgi:hypothetical protein
MFVSAGLGVAVCSWQQVTRYTLYSCAREECPAVERRYALTPESATILVSGKPTFHVAFFLLTSHPMLPEWGELKGRSKIKQSFWTPDLGNAFLPAELLPSKRGIVRSAVHVHPTV